METDNRQILNGENDEAGKRAVGLLMAVSHEVREPLNVITELTELASHGDIPFSTKAQLARIRKSTQYITTIMDDLLDLSLFETGRLKLVQKEFQPDGLISEMAELFSVKCKTAGISFTSRVSPKIRGTYVGDPGRLKQILINLINSALSRTSWGGEIILDVRQTREGHHSADLTFAVIDNGKGFKPQSLQHLTEAYMDDSTVDVEHTLGLAITSDLVQLMGGMMSIDSKVHVGTRITVEVSLTLPDDRASQPKAHEELPAIDINFQNRRILLVEDNQINAEITADMLEMHGFRVEHAVNGEEAVTLFESSASGYYDAILMDIRMPRMNGLDAVRKIRSSNHPDARNVPIIAMSANAFAEDIEKSLEAGMNAHLSKPVDQETLFGCLAEYLL